MYSLMVLGIAWADPVQFGAVQCDLSVSVFGGLLSHGGRMLEGDRQETYGSLSLDASIISAPPIDVLPQ
jgi:hypothetical protein